MNRHRLEWAGISGSSVTLHPSEWFEDAWDKWNSIEMTDVHVREWKIKCVYCGQWGKIHSSCGHCGAPIDG